MSSFKTAKMNPPSSPGQFGTKSKTLQRCAFRKPESVPETGRPSTSGAEQEPPAKRAKSATSVRNESQTVTQQMSDEDTALVKNIAMKLQHTARVEAQLVEAKEVIREKNHELRKIRAEAEKLKAKDAEFEALMKEFQTTQEKVASLKDQLEEKNHLVGELLQKVADVRHWIKSSPIE